MQNKGNKNTQSSYLSFEQIFMNSLHELFHPESENRIINLHEFNLIDLDYIHDFLETPIIEIGELFDTKQLRSLVNWDDLKLFNKKDLDLVNWKQVSFFTQYVGALTILMVAIAGYTSALSMAMDLNVNNRRDEVFASKVYLNKNAESSSETFLAYVDQSAYVAESQEIDTRVLGASTTEGCSFGDSSGNSYNDGSVMNVSSDSGAIQLCGVDMSGKGQTYVWSLSSSSVPVVSNEACMDFDSGETETVVLDVFNAQGDRSSTCSLAVSYESN